MPDTDLFPVYFLQQVELCGRVLAHTEIIDYCALGPDKHCFVEWIEETFIWSLSLHCAARPFGVSHYHYK